MTKLLYMDDSYLKEWKAKVTKVEGEKVFLDQTAFYPFGGGQPNDTGNIEKEGEVYHVTNVRKESGEIAHYTDRPGLGPGDEVVCSLDWNRRYILMRMHTAAHLLSSLINKRTEALITGNQLGTEKSRIDFSLEEYSPEILADVVKEANELVQKGAEVKAYYLPREEAFRIPGIVKLADRLPPSVDKLRIVEIEGIDVQADGGTHVKNITEIGKILVLKTENKGKNNRRLYFGLE